MCRLYNANIMSFKFFIFKMLVEYYTSQYDRDCYNKNTENNNCWKRPDVFVL